MLHLDFCVIETDNSCKPYSVYCFYFNSLGVQVGKHFVSAFYYKSEANLKARYLNDWYCKAVAV